MRTLISLFVVAVLATGAWSQVSSGGDSAAGGSSSGGSGGGSGGGKYIAPPDSGTPDSTAPTPTGPADSPTSYGSGRGLRRSALRGDARGNPRAAARGMSDRRGPNSGDQPLRLTALQFGLRSLAAV